MCGKTFRMEPKDLLAALRDLLTAAHGFGAAEATSAQALHDLQKSARGYYAALRALGGEAGRFDVALETRDGQEHHTVLSLQRARSHPGAQR